MNESNRILSQVVSGHLEDLLDAWISEQLNSDTVHTERLSQRELRQESREFLQLFATAVRTSPESDALNTSAWDECKGFLSEVASKRNQQGLLPTQAATFVFALKKPLFRAMRDISGGGPGFIDEIWRASLFLDQLGLYIAEVSIETREQTIERQRDEMMELSTPVVQLWPGILAMPLIGTLDSSRAQTVTEALLESIVRNNADIAILDITGVPMVDTQVAQHLLKTVAAARLMGAECYVSGIRPQIAQTIVHLGVELSEVTTRATLSDAFKDALKRLAVNPAGKA
ncbi:MAG: STAS domain-containing protein [Opitutales bacterium]